MMYRVVSLVERSINRLHRELTYINLQRMVIHLAGPKQVKLEDDECAAVILGCDAAYYLPEMIRHHFELGVKCCIYLDNGSVDDSCDVAMSFPDVTVLRTKKKLSHSVYENLLRRVAASKTVEGGWRLIVDCDELFDYPGSDRISFVQLIRYLNAMGYTGVVAQMLEMLPAAEVSPRSMDDFQSAIEEMEFYSLRSVVSFEYSRGMNSHYYLGCNSVSDGGVKILSGGVRKEIFGENCVLSKHALVKPASGVTISVHPHISIGLEIADFTCLIRHYKFAGDFIAREADRVAAGHAGGESKLRWSKLKGLKNFDFGVPEMQRFDGAQSLVDQGFLYVGHEARRHLFHGP